MVFLILTGAAARLLANVMWEEVTAILIHIVLAVSHVGTIIVETIIPQPEATGLALLIVVKVRYNDDSPLITRTILPRNIASILSYHFSIFYSLKHRQPHPQP